MYYNWEKNINTKELEIVAKKINEGGLVVFPTETVYGIGANAFDENAVGNIFIAKGRPNDNPLIVHVCNKKQIEMVAEDINEIEKKLIENFMPGPFSLILKKKSIVPNCVSAGLDTIAIRMPNNKIALEIIEKSETPLAAPSANISGKPSGTNIEDIIKELENKVDFIIDGGKTQIGIESTVVKVIDGIPTILRPGFITPQEIKNVVGKVNIDKNVFKVVKENEYVESPGMKYKHYAPNTKCKLIYSENEAIQINKINDLIKEYTNAVVLGFNEHKEKINSNNFISLGSKNNYLEIAQNIYSALRKADLFNAEIIFIEGISKEGIGIAIMNRLLRTCEYDYLEI